MSYWFKLNKLSLNIKKTNFIVFQTRNKKLPNGNLTIKIDDTVIEQVNNTKFLGVIINNKLTWDEHIKTIYNKVSKSIGIIYRIRHNIPSATLINLYHTLVHPYYEYCNIIWGSNNSTALQRLGRSQKRAVRAVVFAGYRSHTAPIFKRLNIISLTKINKVQTACFVYKVLNNLLPSQFNSFLHPIIWFIIIKLDNIQNYILYVVVLKFVLTASAFMV